MAGKRRHMATGEVVSIKTEKEASLEALLQRKREEAESGGIVIETASTNEATHGLLRAGASGLGKLTPAQEFEQKKAKKRAEEAAAAAAEAEAAAAIARAEAAAAAERARIEAEAAAARAAEAAREPATSPEAPDFLLPPAPRRLASPRWNASWSSTSI